LDLAAPDARAAQVTERRWRIRVDEEPGETRVFVLLGARNWAHARVTMGEQIAPFLADDCMDCRLDATEAWNRLAALGRDDPFQAEIDGRWYLIELEPDPPVSRTNPPEEHQ
jgi:hypothetical protein